jgi:hypothetical protein
LRKNAHVSDPIVQKMILLHRRLETAASEGSIVQGWRPLRLDSKGWIVAGKNINGEYHIEQFCPIGQWKKAHEYLEIQIELRKLIFSDLTVEQMDEYRAAIGISEG